MLCYRYKKMLVPYSEGALDEAARVRLEAHLERCESCRAELECVRSVGMALTGAQLPDVEPAADLWARVARGIAEPVAPERKPWLRAPQAVSAFATVLLLAVVGVTAIWMDLGQDRTITQPSIDRSSTPSVVEKAPVTKPEVASSDGAVSRPSPVAHPVVRKPVAPAPAARMAAARTVRPHSPARRERARGTTKGTVMAMAGSPTKYDARDRYLETPSTDGDPNLAYSAVPGPDADSAERVKVATAAPASVAEGTDFKTGYAPALTATVERMGTEESVVDTLNDAQGVKVAALFSFP